MNKEQVLELLEYASSMDGRTVTQDTVEAWHGLLGEVHFAVALTIASRHYTHETARLMPAHILREVRHVRRDAFERLPAAERDGGAENPAHLDQYRRDRTRRIDTVLTGRPAVEE